MPLNFLYNLFLSEQRTIFNYIAQRTVESPHQFGFSIKYWDSPPSALVNDNINISTRLLIYFIKKLDKKTVPLSPYAERLGYRISTTLSVICFAPFLLSFLYSLLSKKAFRQNGRLFILIFILYRKTLSVVVACG